MILHQKNELSLIKHEFIMVTKMNGKWWFGYREFKPKLRGYFPSNCLKLIKKKENNKFYAFKGSILKKFKVFKVTYL